MPLTGFMRSACLCGLFLSGATAASASQTYVYAVEHPTYGKIGSFIETIDKEAGVTRISTELRVAVKVIGIVVHREDASTTELWQGTRLAAMRAVSEINGKRTEVSGATDKGAFDVSSAAGTQSAPADVKPSDPWVLTGGVGRGVILSTRSGIVEDVNVSGGESDPLKVEGTEVAARHFRIDAASQPDRYEVWLDGNNVPVKFRSREAPGEPIDFVLESTEGQQSHAAAGSQKATGGG
jgi:hypothetical protein